MKMFCIRKNICSYGKKIIYCSCRATWLPCKTSIKTNQSRNGFCLSEYFGFVFKASATQDRRWRYLTTKMDLQISASQETSGNVTEEIWEILRTVSGRKAQIMSTE